MSSSSEMVFLSPPVHTTYTRAQYCDPTTCSYAVKSRTYNITRGNMLTQHSGWIDFTVRPLCMDFSTCSQQRLTGMFFTWFLSIHRQRKGRGGEERGAIQRCINPCATYHVVKLPYVDNLWSWYAGTNWAIFKRHLITTLLNNFLDCGTLHPSMCIH